MWLNVAQSGSIAVWRFSAVRLGATQCGSMWLNFAPHAPHCQGGRPWSEARKWQVAGTQAPSSQRLTTANGPSQGRAAPAPRTWRVRVACHLGSCHLALPISALVLPRRTSPLHPSTTDYPPVNSGPRPCERLDFGTPSLPLDTCGSMNVRQPPLPPTCPLAQMNKVKCPKCGKTLTGR